MQKVQLGKVARNLRMVDSDSPAVDEAPAADGAFDQFGPMVAILNAGSGAARMLPIEHANFIENVYPVFAR
jgi:hypothetical protein